MIFAKVNYRHFFSHLDISVSGEHLNITRIRLPTLAVDGTTGEYTCEVCHNQGMQNNGKICVNSTVPIRGRSES